MNGKNHIICTNAMAISSFFVHHTCSNILSGKVTCFWGIEIDFLKPVLIIDKYIWDAIGFSNINISLLILFKLALFLIVVTFGTLFTDCDSEKSIMGRYIHIPVEHRTWLHAIYIPLIFCLIGISNSLLYFVLWFGLGWFLHEFMDSFSYCGNAYLYPFISYRKYGHAKVKKGVHLFKLYRTNEPSENYFVTFVVFMCLLIALLFLFSPRFDIIGDGVGLWAS